MLSGGQATVHNNITVVYVHSMNINYREVSISMIRLHSNRMEEMLIYHLTIHINVPVPMTSVVSIDQPRVYTQMLHCSCGAILLHVFSSSKGLEQDCHLNKVGDRYNNIADDEPNFPV